VTFAFVVSRLVFVVAVAVAVAAVTIVGPGRLAETRRTFRERFDAIVPYVGLLAVVLVANKIARDVGPEVSELFGIRITGWLRRVDGRLLWPLYPSDTPQVVAWLQSMATPELTAYFSLVYVYGYVFLLVFPLVAYISLPRPEPIRRTMIAYGANYLIGVLCYVAFVAYGPRNLIVEQAEGLLYTQYTHYQFVTDAVNDETNVFPSLHTSMAVTAALLAWSTREAYPVWVPISAVLAASVVVSTMYLGIHWATDVLFGIVLAWISVAIGRRYEDTPPTLEGFRDRLGAVGEVIPGRLR
jgi:membrane-associated phospholipid phosphatase